jgi:hypothetical protein
MATLRAAPKSQDQPRPTVWANPELPRSKYERTVFLSQNKFILNSRSLATTISIEGAEFYT